MIQNRGFGGVVNGIAGWDKTCRGGQGLRFAEVGVLKRETGSLERRQGEGRFRVKACWCDDH